MSDKDPSFWQSLYLSISISPIGQGSTLATIIAALRVLYDDQETKMIRVILEASLCGSLALCVSSIVEMLNLPTSATVTIGGTIGFIGVTTLRDKLLKIINRKIDNEEESK
ncbi:phage holin, lambda family [Entomomonas asaccharolytica]|uniref:Phage holin, lambda family n=1 Tax=Entomomonas asaccharolytica TaxID=2785331 RepID=A0A974NG09_9GAMM|nr:phage holin, lambda family [Entomomonas asaccharolytica]QQP86096.1 phage holin, lambda family [Entomomonas asaccharolytica]